MDRISALRNVEDALATFEAGECDLAGLERQVRAIVRTYASEFEGDLAAYRADPGDDRDLVVLASSPTEARRRARDLLETDAEIDVERVS